MYYYMYYILPSLLFLTLLRKYQEYKWGYCKNMVTLAGKVVLITGANSGIGFETAKELAKRGAKIIFACRDLEKAKAAITKIQSVSATSSLIPMQLDLQSIKSITTFIEELKKSETKIDILINNAGVSYPKQSEIKTSDGFEVHFGVNHLSHFCLTNSLVPLLRAAAPSRVVVVSSTLHQKGTIYLDDLNLESKLGKTPGYNNSKLANAYFAQELARKVKSDHIKVYCVCPGWVYTGLFRNHNIKWFHYIFVAPIAFLFMRSAKQGAQTLIYCATEPNLGDETGLFYRDCKLFQSKVLFHDKIAHELWVKSEQMIDDVKTKMC